ncbi:MAG TPA: hypothetical protein VGF45_20465, partial [Polyangia bacterium]
MRQPPSMTAMNGLPLEDYRGLIGLDAVFVPPAPLAERETATLLASLLGRLGDERVGRSEGRSDGAGEVHSAPLSALPDLRARLRERLTVREPTPLADDVHAELDRLLQTERRARHETRAGGLPRLGESAV